MSPGAAPGYNLERASRQRGRSKEVELDAREAKGGQSEQGTAGRGESHTERMFWRICRAPLEF